LEDWHDVDVNVNANSLHLYLAFLRFEISNAWFCILEMKMPNSDVKRNAAR